MEQIQITTLILFDSNFIGISQQHRAYDGYIATTRIIAKKICFKYNLDYYI